MAKLYKRGKVWYAKLKVHGRRVRKRLSTNALVAQSLLADLIKQREEAATGTNHNGEVSWSAFRQRVLDHLRGERKNPGTVAGYNRAFNAIESCFPLTRVKQVTPALLDEAKIKWQDRGLYVVNKDIANLKAAMRKAELWRYTPKQEWRTVKRFKEPKGRLHFFTASDLRLLMTVCRGRWLTILLLGARAGLRRGEMYWLEWSDVDFDRNRIHIAPKESWNPKDYERRWIPMAPDLVAHLRKLSLTPHDRRVLGPRATQPTVGSMTTYFRRLIRKAKLKGSIHTLRHTFGSHLAQNGVPLIKIKAWMGHASIEMTEIYTHLMPVGPDEKDIERLPAIV